VGQGRGGKKGPGGQRQQCQVVSGIQSHSLAACRTAYLSLAEPPRSDCRFEELDWRSQACGTVWPAGNCHLRCCPAAGV
jgi:hypothetical protein